VATLGGPRISELCLLDSPDVDLAARAIRIPRVKTDASERVVPMVAALHEILLAYRAERPSARSGAAFETRRGTRQSPDNVRARLLAAVRERADELLEWRGERPIAHLTPHTLRRTFASLLAEVGISPRRTMYLLGHSDPSSRCASTSRCSTWADPPRGCSCACSAAPLRRRSPLGRDGGFPD
jgi:integrase